MNEEDDNVQRIGESLLEAGRDAIRDVWPHLGLFDDKLLNAVADRVTIAVLKKLNDYNSFEIEEPELP